MKKTMMILLGAALLGLAGCAHSESETSKAEAKSTAAAPVVRSSAQQALDAADMALQAANEEFARSGNSPEMQRLMGIAESKIEQANAIAPNEECRERAQALQVSADKLSQEQSRVAEAAPPAPAPQPAKPKKVPSPEGAIAVSDFEVSDATLSPGMKEQLDAVVAKVGDTEAMLVIEGHTDNTGTDGYNERLSLTRAAAGRDYLVAKGIDAKRIEIKGAGSSKPAASNDSAKDRAKNRRIEIVFSTPAPVS